MLRYKGWIIGLSTLFLILAVAVHPGMGTGSAPPDQEEFALSPSISSLLGGCPSVTDREAAEETDCLQSARLGLVSGRLSLNEAIARVQNCALRRPELVALGEKSAALRHERARAQIVFGDSTSLYEAIFNGAGDLRAEAARIPAEHVTRLVDAGITSYGIAAGREREVLNSLRTDPSLRRSFRAVFGNAMADDLNALLSPGTDAYQPAVIIGRSVIVPNFSSASASGGGESSAAGIVTAENYGARVAGELRSLEAARLRYLRAAAREHYHTGSVQTFLAGLRASEGATRSSQDLAAGTQAGLAGMSSRLGRLEERLGLDPLLLRAAEESVGTATAVNRSCQETALQRQRNIRTSAVALGGLIGAAGVVVATGATGTVLGGVIIVAALEGSLGAYIIARNERLASADVMSPARSMQLAGKVGEARLQMGGDEVQQAGGTEAAAQGLTGTLEEEWLLDEGTPWEWSDIEGEGIEETSSEFTQQGNRVNTIAPELPIELPEALAELPPNLNTEEIRNLSDLTLPEIQERLEQFLSLRDPAQWATLVDDEEDLAPSTIEEMVSEAQSALRLWAQNRVLSEGFGPFFIKAELEMVGPRQRPDILTRAMGRYAFDRESYAGSRNVDEIRSRVAQQLVTHCRVRTVPGDLVLRACTPDGTALSMVIIAALRDAGVNPPPGSSIGIQAFDRRFEAVVYDSVTKEVFSLTRGDRVSGVVAPIYHPATFYYAYLVSHNVIPEINPDEHLLIALPDRADPESVGGGRNRCDENRSILGKALDLIGSFFGIHRLGPCDSRGEGGEGGEGEEGSSPRINIAMPMPQNPFQRGGGQSGGGAGGGSGSGGGSSMSASSPSSGRSSGGSSGGSQAGSGGSSGQSQGSGASGSSNQGGQGSGASPSGVGNGNALSEGDVDPALRRDGGGPAGSPSARQAGNGGSGEEGGSNSNGSGGTGGYSIGYSAMGVPDLFDVAHEASLMSSQFGSGPSEIVAPWRLRSDEGMLTGSASRVLFADNERAMARFDDDDLFITLTPAEVEAQRRMLEADLFMIYPASTTCETEGLPPRRVFRRAAPGSPGFRYFFCDQDESSVVFRKKSDAERYANLIPPDRPLFLAALASTRLQSFEQSEPVQRLQAFLQDPNVLREYSRDEIHAMVKAASDLLVFQNALESTLVQSMNELETSPLRGYYYELHKQVLQAPLFVQMAAGVYRLNQRLASDPLQSLAWANAQPALAKQGFFDLYYTLGGMMEWPDRWSNQQTRFGNTSGNAPQRDPAARSIDFLQVLSDPVRVQIDWTSQISGRPSISDRAIQEGAERTTALKSEPTNATRQDRQEIDEHRRGGTGGLGRAGEGDARGPDSGSLTETDRRPVQMIYVRLASSNSQPERRLPEKNAVRPGGTEGRNRTHTEQSATRQEPILWVTPNTFAQAVLSTWDNNYLRPAEAGRIPPILRFNQRLREIFLRDLRPEQVFDNRLRGAMEVFTDGSWLRFNEVRAAMGGSWVSVRARDTGRFSAAYSGNPPIFDQDQIRIPNFFTRSGVILPADLYEPVREHYTRAILGIFELTRSDEVSLPTSINSLPLSASENAAQNRATLLRNLEMIRQQAEEARAVN